MVTNLVNNKKYIGQSISKDIHNRWNTHKKIRKDCLGTCLYNAYMKYGINQFKYKIICICFDEDCNRYEEEYIKKYNTITPNGYNMKLKGGSYTVSEETKLKLSQKTKEWWHIKGGYVEKRKKVGQFDIYGNCLNTYESIVEAGIKTGFCRRTISKVCNGYKGYHTAGGFIWKFLS